MLLSPEAALRADAGAGDVDVTLGPEIAAARRHWVVVGLCGARDGAEAGHGALYTSVKSASGLLAVTASKPWSSANRELGGVRRAVSELAGCAKVIRPSETQLSVSR